MFLPRTGAVRPGVAGVPLGNLMPRLTAARTIRQLFLLLVLCCCGFDAHATIQQTWVWTCYATRGTSTVVLPGSGVPTCNPASSGEWVQIKWDDATDALTMSDIGALTTTAFLVLGVAWGFRQVVVFTRNR